MTEDGAKTSHIRLENHDQAVIWVTPIKFLTYYVIALTFTNMLYCMVYNLHNQMNNVTYVLYFHQYKMKVHVNDDKDKKCSNHKLLE